MGSRPASHLVDVARKRSCTGSVHSSGSFCTKLKAWTPRTPLSWFAAGAPGRMPAVRRPAMHHSSLCAGAYLKGHRETRLEGGKACGERTKAQEENGERNGFHFSLPGLYLWRPRPFISIARLGRGSITSEKVRDARVVCVAYGARRAVLFQRYLFTPSPTLSSPLMARVQKTSSM